ncbi:hypothetical protein SCLCIDRAFT_506629 [Scleroderma citrinum Foug A]|uniref:Uncharacterized protein n=1 Tax=Scleroderma citrinum Foug A TaxID=1036808 RepID=A0A0C3EQR6_9AGAM|nr:hypothetical protein SCLCIDRAFT_506629 [Scleroderma citrinum Foug A]
MDVPVPVTAVVSALRLLVPQGESEFESSDKIPSRRVISRRDKIASDAFQIVYAQLVISSPLRSVI